MKGWGWGGGFVSMMGERDLFCFRWESNLRYHFAKPWSV